MPRVLWRAGVALLLLMGVARADLAVVGSSVADQDGGGTIGFPVDPAADPGVVTNQIRSSLELSSGAQLGSITVMNGVAQVEFTGASVGATVSASLPRETAAAPAAAGPAGLAGAEPPAAAPEPQAVAEAPPPAAPVAEAIEPPDEPVVASAEPAPISEPAATAVELPPRSAETSPAGGLFALLFGGPSEEAIVEDQPAAEVGEPLAPEDLAEVTRRAEEAEVEAPAEVVSPPEPPSPPEEAAPPAAVAEAEPEPVPPPSPVIEAPETRPSSEAPPIAAIPAGQVALEREVHSLRVELAAQQADFQRWNQTQQARESQQLADVQKLRGEIDVLAKEMSRERGEREPLVREIERLGVENRELAAKLAEVERKPAIVPQAEEPAVEEEPAAAEAPAPEEPAVAEPAAVEPPVETAPEPPAPRAPARRPPAPKAAAEPIPPPPPAAPARAEPVVVAKAEPPAAAPPPGTPPEITVHGLVRKPGKYPIAGLKTVGQAIAAARTLSGADLKKIELERRTTRGTTKSVVDLLEVWRGRVPDPAITAGDVITVPGDRWESAPEPSSAAPPRP